MINRDDMLELTRRMTLARTCFDRIAGAYIDDMGEVDGYPADHELVYDFIICTVSPLQGEYEPSEPVFGFLYPAFSDRSADRDKIDIYHADPGKPEEGLLHKLLN